MPESTTEATAGDGKTDQATESLKQDLVRAQAQAAEYLDGWQRARAEFANYRKRQEAERSETMAYNRAQVLAKVLPVLDDLQRAVQTIPEEIADRPWTEGVRLIARKLENVVEAEGIQPIETSGQAFDPRYHEAISYEEAAGHEEGQVIAEVQRGYRLGERVLRPALVRVAK